MSNEKTITIQIGTDDESLIGGGTWGEYDRDESIANYTRLIREAIEAEFPDYEVDVEGGSYKTIISIDDDRSSYETREDQEEITRIIERIWNAQDWYIAA